MAKKSSALIFPCPKMLRAARAHTMVPTRPMTTRRPAGDGLKKTRGFE
jgi:hypothetical protein